MKKWVLYSVFFLALFTLFLHPIDSGDFFHHLNSGRYIAQHFSLPYRDDLSFTAYGKPWVAHSWGAGLVFYLIYAPFGSAGISILFAFLGLLASFFLFLTLRKLRIGRTTSFVLVFLSAGLLSLRWPSRPEVLGPTFLIALVYLLCDYQRKRRLLIPFFLIWGVMYGSSTFLGIAVFAFYLVVYRLFDRKNIILFFLSILASLLNGYGLRSFLYIFQIPSIAPHVGEWLPIWATLNPDLPGLVLFYQYRVIVYGLLVLTYLIVLILGLISNRKRIFASFFLLVVSFAVFAPLYTNRFINVAALLAMPIVGITLETLSKRTRLIFLGLSCLLALAAICVSFRPLSLQVGLGGPFQTKVTQYLKENGVNGNIYSMQEIGSFLSWELPGSKIFVDTRDDLYQPLGIFSELRQLDEGKIDMISLLNTYHANIVVGELGGLSGVYKPLFYSNNWSLVYLTDGYFVMLRNDVVKKHSTTTYDALDPLRIPPAKPGELEKAEVELTKIISEDPSSIENQVRLVEIKLALDKPIEAKGILERLDLAGHFGAGQGVADIATFELLGKTYLAANECDKAFDFLTKADKLSYKQLIFFPNIRLPTTVDLYLGKYYLVCKNDRERARKFWERYLQNNNNPLERRAIEQKLELFHTE